MNSSQKVYGKSCPFKGYPCLRKTSHTILIYVGMGLAPSWTLPLTSKLFPRLEPLPSTSRPALILCPQPHILSLATHSLCQLQKFSPALLELTDAFLLRSKLPAFLLDNLRLCLCYKGLIRQFTLETRNLLLCLANLFIEPA